MWTFYLTCLQIHATTHEVGTVFPHHREKMETEFIAQHGSNGRTGICSQQSSFHSSPLEPCNFKYDKNVHLSQKQHLEPPRFSPISLFRTENPRHTGKENIPKEPPGLEAI